MAATRLLSLHLLLLSLAAVSARATPTSDDTVETTCAKAMAGGQRLELAPFCVSSLEAAPGSAGTDARGLAAIATNLTLANYTAAVATVKALQLRGGWAPGERAALATCRTRYIEALKVVHSAVHALATRRVRDYVADMTVVRSAAADCDEAFRAGVGAGAGTTGEEEVAGGEPPMRKVDEDAMNLASVAMLIVMSLE